MDMHYAVIRSHSWIITTWYKHVKTLYSFGGIPVIFGFAIMRHFFIRIWILYTDIAYSVTKVQYFRIWFYLSLMQTSGMLQAISKLQENVLKSTYHESYRAMYSSILGGIITDPALMLIPLDDHMVHRGHGVFDTALIIDGYEVFFVVLQIFTIWIRL